MASADPAGAFVRASPGKPACVRPRGIGAVVHRRSGPTACLILESKGMLTYGDEVPIQFEVSARPVLYRSTRQVRRQSDSPTMLSILAVNRVEATITAPLDPAAWRGKHLVLAAWPYSLGMVCPSRFRSCIKKSREGELERLADKHVDNLHELLRELDGLDEDLQPDLELPAIEPTLTTPGQVIAGRYLLDRFDPANAGKRMRVARENENVRGDDAPGWLLGLCDFDHCLDLLMEDHERIGADAWQQARKPRGSRSVSTLRDSAIAECVERACKFALAGLRDRDGPDIGVVANATRICATLIETHVKSQSRGDSPPPGTTSLRYDPEDPDQE